MDRPDISTRRELLQYWNLPDFDHNRLATAFHGGIPVTTPNTYMAHQSLMRRILPCVVCGAGQSPPYGCGPWCIEGKLE